MGIAERTHRRAAGPVDLAVLPTGIQDVVTIRGSIDTTPDFANGGELLQDWLARTLDKGSEQRDRFEIADVLENLGAQIGFSSSGARLRFSARCLRPDLETVVNLLFEQLERPELSDAELSKGKDRIAAAIQRGITDAGYRADTALAQSVFEPSHPNYLFEPEAEQELLDTMSQAAVRDAHNTLLRGRPRMVVVGDVDPDACSAAIASAANGWGSEPAEGLDPTPPVRQGGTRQVEIADRDNLEVRWAHGMPLSRLSDDYLPAFMASFILGGNFSARLMNEVREKRGLTYGIGSGLRGMDARYQGMWRVHVTLSQENLDAGIQATEEVIRQFCSGGATAEELSDKKQTIAGSFQVRLATTGGLAGSLLQQMEDGRPLDWVDRYPDRIQACTLEQVNAAVEAHFDPDALTRTVAGTIPQTV